MNLDPRLEAQLIGVAFMMKLGPDIYGRDPAWVGNIECACEGAVRSQAWELYFLMALNWWVPAIHEYMDDRVGRDPVVTDRLVEVLRKCADFEDYRGTDPNKLAIAAAVRRLRKGSAS